MTAANKGLRVLEKHKGSFYSCRNTVIRFSLCQLSLVPHMKKRKPLTTTVHTFIFHGLIFDDNFAFLNMIQHLERNNGLFST